MEAYMSNDGENQQTFRHSSRQQKMTEKGLNYRRELLLEDFRSDRTKLFRFLADTDRELQKGDVDCDDLILRRMTVTSRLSSLRETAEKIKGLGEDTVNIDDELTEVVDTAVTTINKIVTATKHLNTTSLPSSRSSRTSTSSGRSGGSSSTVSSRKLTAAAEAAALKVKLEALRIENDRQEELSRLEVEEKMRRLEAEKKMAQVKRRIEEEKLESQLRTEEVRLQILDEVSCTRSSSGVSVDRSTGRSVEDWQMNRPKSSQVRDHSTASNLRVDAPDFVPDHQTTGTHLVDALTRAITSSRLPIPEPPIFTGDPLLYQDWLFSFQSLIENRGVPPVEKIHYLKRYLGGPAKEAIAGFFMLRSENAYQRARDVLEQRFGNQFVISEAFRTKLDTWPSVGNKDKAGLRKLSDFLLQCLAAVEEVKDLRILDDVREIQKITAKLPDWMVHRWNRKTASSRRDFGRYPAFREFALFVAEESEIVNDPMLSSEPSAARPSVRHHNVKQPSGKTVLNTHTGETPRLSCTFCKKQYHSLSDCRDFMKKEMTERKDYIKKEGLCFGCLKKGHRSKQCTNRNDCKKCKRKHPTSLHEDSPPSGGQWSATQETKVKLPVEQSSGVGQPQCENQHKDHQNASCRKVSSRLEHSLTSMAVPVYLSTEKNPEHEILVYALLDTMSDTTFVLDSVAEDLQASYEPATLRLTTLTDNSSTVLCKKYGDLRVRGFNSERIVSLPITYSRNIIPLDKKHVPTPETASQWTHLGRLENLLTPKQNCPVGLLIGYNCPRALAPLNSVVGNNNEPFAVETELGWSIVGGGSSSEGNVHKTYTEEVTAGSAADLIQLMGQDFKEPESHLKSMSQEDKKFLKTLEEGIHHREDGFYEMPLPFRNGEPSLPNNRQAALHRVLSLKKQFDKKPQYFQHYTAFMKEILERGDAEKIPDSEMDVPNQWYIPHHGVYHPKKPGKVRVVFDCSARHQGVCINDHLLQGPDLINSLVGVLCRFREGPIAFTCDIEKMFHQFRVEKGHQDYLRFLWWEDGDLSKPPSDYRMKVHLFGASSSPGCANFALKQLAKDHRYIGEKAAEFLKEDFYVDDGLKGESSVEAAVDLLEKARLICAKGNLRLHKIISNNAEVMKSVPESERGNAVPTNLETDHGDSAIERALGLQWCMESDSFCFKLSLKDNPLTRRGILSTVASIFDPLGLISPVILAGRQILQSMCKENLSWDHPIPENLRPQWEKWREELQKLKDVKIPRCYHPEGFGSPVSVQLHHFSDASLSGYGRCSYLRLENGDGQVHCTLVTAKARVTPLKVTTVPRLELQAAVLSATAARVLETELSYPNITHHFWTDSKVVLGYIQNEATRFHMYVANRVEQIHQNSQAQQWHYVATAENPADHASRGLSVEELSTSNWFTGPAFLWKKEIATDNIDIEISPQDTELKSATVHMSQRSQFTSFEERVGRFSSYSKLIAAVAVIIKCCARKKKEQLSSLEAKQKAERNLIRVIQKEKFEETCELKSRSHPLQNLDPFHDNDNVLRVGGRLRKTSEMYGVKHPAILPKNSHLSHLIAAHHHQKTAHQGRNMTINEIRSGGYWIVGCRRVVSSLINKCVTCNKHRGKNRGQKMADLPEERVEPSPPFTYCGLDCFGPFIVKEGRREMKRYGLIFTCLAMRAIHIEVLDDLTTDSFLNGLRCFIAIRGKVRMIRCDQGTNFVGAKHELKENLKKLDQEAITSKLLDLECEFKLNPPSSSHMGGVWERQIRNVRNVLTSILDSGSRLDTSSLRTVMYEAMAIVNSRPLTVENLERADGPLPLTPNHLLTMKSGVVMPPPPGKFDREDLYLKKRWRRVQFLVNLFWTRWKREYLQTLQTRNTWQQTQRNVRMGDIVLLQEDGICRTDWKVAKVVETYASDDGLIRKVRLLMATSQLDKQGKPKQQRTYLERPVHKLVVLLPDERSTAE